MVITTDVSSIHSLSRAPNSSSLRIAGTIKDTPVHILLDGGSTHNFINPAIAVKLSLPLHPITPFRVYVGNGDSLCCSSYCPNTQLTLQDNIFDVDLYILSIHGPVVVLNVQWLQTLGKVSHDYANMTMEFSWNNQPVTLRGDLSSPRPISYHALFTLTASHQQLDFYELFSIHEDTLPTPPNALEFPADIPPPIRAVLDNNMSVFSLSSGMPPARRWDH